MEAVSIPTAGDTPYVFRCVSEATLKVTNGLHKLPIRPLVVCE
jgi:hypothetical protein